MSMNDSGIHHRKTWQDGSVSIGVGTPWDVYTGNDELAYFWAIGFRELVRPRWLKQVASEAAELALQFPATARGIWGPSVLRTDRQQLLDLWETEDAYVDRAIIAAARNFDEEKTFLLAKPDKPRSGMIIQALVLLSRNPFAILGLDGKNSALWSMDYRHATSWVTGSNQVAELLQKNEKFRHGWERLVRRYTA